ncbi:putative enzyme related to lactoylglutathione lyase [Branchiibius hedensis]|uniref:VOC domain-containing protein n=1 Tax=Branchiibius hedensis TaxID=672460 RepID=A0A2Y8ZM25_9MICO|nr:VOC family protein [Branchiibius hedensis]PWJ24006.1 putative enzyme related to lactoylglutathione lyase [Branchiibius hedensis]SSA32824.1 hypothetical protein SAMN04489750_0089 [Branchiibius hedensis]
MSTRIAGVTIDCRDPHALARFWSQLLGRPVTAEHSDDNWASVGSVRDSTPRLTFQRVPEPNVGKVRLHLDIQVDDVSEAQDRVLELGGSLTGERHDYDEGVVVVVRDPEGHEFCLVQFF